MRIPVTDAFDDTGQLQSLEIELSPHQIEWLRQKADERGLSVDHMVRTILTAQMRDEDGDDAVRSSESGDGVPHSHDDAPTPSVSGDDEMGEEDDETSIVESLRSASERLQELTDDEEGDTADSDLPDTLSRLQGRIDTPSDSDDSEDDPGTVLLDDNPSRSMFDMVEE